MKAEDFFELEKILFKVDAGSYTADAGGIESLDYLFKFGKRLELADSPKNKIEALKSQIGTRPSKFYPRE